MQITARAPVRIDFAGAWTDVSYFADVFGGATLNAAISIYVTGQLLANEDAEGGLTAASRAAGTHPALAVSYESAIPAGSGLGTSATLNVVWLSLARREPITDRANRLRIAELAYDIEKALGIIGGKQDQFASAVGGVNLFEFGSEGVSCSPVELSPTEISELESQLVLCYTGKTRLSSQIHKSVWGKFVAGEQRTIAALFNLRRSAYEAKAALEDHDLAMFARKVSAQRTFMRDLDASTTNAQIEALFDSVEPYILGGKPCGAGGGGCVFFLAKDDEAKQRVKDTLSGQGLEGLDVSFDFDGLVLEMAP
ncbi:MAG TPA: hypothetical protein VGM19_03820 [Armatimonadota bacterium]|jgi:D-glycero-alpha-D-manno-heptose-7-phosphate kinase